MNEEVDLITDAQLLSMAAVYVVTDPITTEPIRIEKRSHQNGFDWVAINAEKRVLTTDGIWVWKPVFDYTDEEFLYRTGFADVRAAILAVTKAFDNRD